MGVFKQCIIGGSSPENLLFTKRTIHEKQWSDHWKSCFPWVGGNLSCLKLTLYPSPILLG
jgi:hypothetical protein